MVLTRQEAGHFSYVMQKGRSFYQPQIQPGAVPVQPGGKKERHFSNQKTVPSYMMRHIESLEQFQAFGSGRNQHADVGVPPVFGEAVTSMARSCFPDKSL
jgi:hypothetical protein